MAQLHRLSAAAAERRPHMMSIVVDNSVVVGNDTAPAALVGRSIDDVCGTQDVQRHVQQQLARVLQIMTAPALLLDADRTIVHANPPAALLLSERDGIVIDHDGRLNVTATFPAEGRALGRCLAAALSAAAGQDVPLSGPLRVSRPSGRAPLLVLVAALPPMPPALPGKRGAMALVQVIDPEAQPRDVTTALQAAGGLTPAEARVAVLVGGGLSRPQAAARLKVSPSTANCQLASCFEKLGVRSQVGLARLMSALPEMLRPAALGRKHKMAVCNGPT
ncbi:helix-turn-helix transcriptional regulator [Vineibacter terrae]|uniref:helix-turn-helix transcriptional regulator n=1 Tax=Vineibacter terrae TaxID=2586908 RepID=UPI002E37B485|nr:helix-turn-helix transcriptional regulator [Vineibacter terrae]HEX2887917.1 helix-turn-helix transcriptional regulator [Vineibacter terrae]